MQILEWLQQLMTATRIHLLESAVFATRMNIESSRQATSHIDVSELGRSIQEMPSFKDEAPVRDLLPPLTAEQWAAFFEDLGMQEQPDGTAWVKPLSQKERDARQACKLRGSLYYASTAPSGTFRAPGLRSAASKWAGSFAHWNQPA